MRRKSSRKGRKLRPTGEKGSRGMRIKAATFGNKGFDCSSCFPRPSGVCLYVCHTISSIGKRAIVQRPCGTPCCCLRYQFKSQLLSFSPNSLIRHLQEQRVMGQRLGPLLPPATPEHSSALLALCWTSPSS